MAEHFEKNWRQVTLDGMEEETRRQVAVYAIKNTFQTGEALPIPNQEWFAPGNGRLVFVDLLPRADWGHPCRYLFISEANGELLETRDWEFPPDANSLQLLYRGDALESWMLLVNQGN